MVSSLYFIYDFSLPIKKNKKNANIEVEAMILKGLL